MNHSLSTSAAPGATVCSATLGEVAASTLRALTRLSKSPLPALGADNERDAVEPTFLDTLANADMMSDMKTFTVRDLDRSPSTVLEASKADGRARIRERGGQTYLVIPEAAPEKPITGLPDFKKRRRRMFNGVLPVSSVQQLDKAVAGE